jgi:hypothetical protein
MREIRTSGSEGGVSSILIPTPMPPSAAPSVAPVTHKAAGCRFYAPVRRSVRRP